MTEQPMTAPLPETGGPGEVLLVDKEKGWTSFDVVNRLRGGLSLRKAGHAGTLDPMATGLLIVCTERRTREVEQYMGLEKEYEVTMVLGGRTASFDAETPVVEERPTEGITRAVVESALGGMTGRQLQTPPMWSALKVRGKPLYAYARKGEEVQRRPREVFVRSIDLRSVEMPRVSFAVVCSKGTYIRSLVDDVGRALGCGAYVAELRRTRIGPFRVADALPVAEIVRKGVGREAGAHRPIA
ncbi:MAG: tRNA pseudouridine(55) synthase TruB [Bacteroidota bacterium]